MNNELFEKLKEVLGYENESVIKCFAKLANGEEVTVEDGYYGDYDPVTDTLREAGVKFEERDLGPYFEDRLYGIKLA